MHKEAIHFIKFISLLFSEYFENKMILDVGGGDINGNNKMFFKNCQYISNDVCESPNVNCVCRTKDLPFDNNHFDTIISTECFEHDPEYKDSFKKIYDLLKPSGFFVFTCASTGRPEHGTRNSKPHQSYGTINDIEDMRDYYKNLTVDDLNEALPLNESFILWKSYYNTFSHDLYFFGIKKGSKDEENKLKYKDVQYLEMHVTETTI
jgi:SAM-dependent methyltransferase